MNVQYRREGDLARARKGWRKTQRALTILGAFGYAILLPYLWNALGPNPSTAQVLEATFGVAISIPLGISIYLWIRHDALKRIRRLEMELALPAPVSEGSVDL